MKYTNKQYAAALLAVVQNAAEKKRLEALERFLKILTRNHDYRHLPAILRQLERLHLTERGIQKVEIYAADPVPTDLKREIEKILAKKIIFIEKKNPDLIAGIKILINDELLIDASAKRQIQKMLAINK